MTLLEVSGLTTHFFTRWGLVRSVDDVSFSVEQGETLGLVGESGCGKSVTCLSILRLVPAPGRVVGGSVKLNGVDLLRLDENEIRAVRGKSISMILQDPMVSLNPVLTVGYQIVEVIARHKRLRGPDARENSIRLLDLVQIPDPRARFRNYPGQLSGGMRQRVAGAIGIASEPMLLMADEPTTSLDLTVQAQYLRLLRAIQAERNMALIFVTHDFGVVAKVCDRVAVMYAGRIVERAGVRELFNNPLHPYTKALIAATMALDSEGGKAYVIQGEPPLLYDLPPGCRFAPRCPAKRDICQRDYPVEVAIGNDHRLSCWKYA